jgi:tRNA-Thr(GGU) m(6)t(6)A37 methyltransferase TsaA
MEKPEGNEVEESCAMIQLKPVGIVRNQSQEASWGERYQALSWPERAEKMRLQSQSVSQLIINPELVEILDGIDEFSHLMVLYWPHLIPEDKRRVLKVHPLGSRDFPLVGTFATHSPARPNSILVTVVRLLSRKDNVLEVTGLDALNGSPLLDIKPYLPERQEMKDVRMPEWMKQMRASFSKT